MNGKNVLLGFLNQSGGRSPLIKFSSSFNFFEKKKNLLNKNRKYKMQQKIPKKKEKSINELEAK